MNIVPHTLSLSPRDGFTLIEMILAIGIAAIVLITVNAAFFAGLHLRESTQQLVDDATPVDQTLTTLQRDLQCITIPTNGTSKVLSGGFRVGNIISSGNATPVSIELYTATGELNDKNPWGDIQRVTYELRDPTDHNARGKDLIRSVTRNLLSETTPQSEDQWMMGGVQDITFSCYDGAQWWTTWDTTGLTSANTNLPAAIKVDIQPVGNQMSPFEIIVPVDLEAVTNVTATTENAGSGSNTGNGSGGNGGGGAGGATGVDSRNGGAGGGGAQ
ncbi:MAG TPA: type II secretion system protein GspJ [Pseudomonadales bacterium]|nr:type II secretion system protein GspJ [Pseudomonadales bacterium]